MNTVGSEIPSIDTYSFLFSNTKQPEYQFYVCEKISPQTTGYNSTVPFSPFFLQRVTKELYQKMVLTVVMATNNQNESCQNTSGEVSNTTETNRVTTLQERGHNKIMKPARMKSTLHPPPKSNNNSVHLIAFDTFIQPQGYSKWRAWPLGL